MNHDHLGDKVIWPTKKKWKMSREKNMNVADKELTT